MPDLALKILLQAEDRASGVVRNLAGSFGLLNGPAGLAVMGIAAIGTAVLGLGVAAAKMDADYQQAMTQLQNTTGSTDAQMGQYASSIRQISDQTGVAQTDLAKGMYQVVSANFAGADATRILTTATKAAVIAGADQTQVTTGLVVTLNAFGLKANQVDTVSNQMFKTLGLGRGNISDLAGALQTGGALVAHYGVSVTDMDATLATLSTGGMKTFGTSMTGLTQLLNVMDGKTDLIAKRIHKLGLPFDEAKFKTMSYTEQVAYLNKTLENNKGQEVAILGSKQAAVALSTLDTHAQLLKDNINKLGDAQQLAKEKADAWAKTQKDFNFQMQDAKTKVQNLMIDLGGQLLPIFSKMVTQITPIVMRLIEWITKSGILQTVMSLLANAITIVLNVIQTLVTAGANFIKFLQEGSVWATLVKGVLILLGGAILGFIVSAIPPMVVAFIAWATAAGAAAIATLAAAAPFIIIGAIVVGIIALIVLAVTHWGQIMDFFANKAAITADKAAIKHDQAKIKAINHTEEQAKGVIKNLDKERAGVEEKLKNTTDASARYHLMMQLDAIDKAKKQQEGVVKQQELQKQKVIQHMKEMQTKLQEDNKNWFVRFLDDILGFFGMVFGAIGNFFGNIFGAIGGFVGNILGTLGHLKDMAIQKIVDLVLGIVTWFINLKNQVVQKVIDFVAGIITWFVNLKNQAVQKVQDFGTAIANFFTSLPGKALKWGENLITGFLNGVGNIAKNIGSFFGDHVLGPIKNFLGFHSPTKEGPGSDADTWAPSLMNMFTQGIIGGLPAIKVAVSQAAQLMQEGFTGASDQLHQQINAAQYQMYQQKEATDLANWNKHKHKAGSQFKEKAYTAALGLFANNTTISDAGAGINNETSTNSSINNTPQINLHFHTQAADPRAVANYAVQKLSEAFNSSGQMITATSGLKN